MAKINSRSKGSKNERELCKFFQDWTSYEFARVPASGGLRWKNTQNTVGDIICTDNFHSRRFKLTIETKFYKDINFEHFILGNKNVKLNEFWEQAKDDGIRSNKIPIVFMRYNNMPKQTWFVMASIELFNEIYLDLNGKFDYGRISIIDNGDPRIIFNSNDLLRTNYKQIHKMVKKLLKNV